MLPISSGISSLGTCCKRSKHIIIHVPNSNPAVKQPVPPGKAIPADHVRRQTLISKHRTSPPFCPRLDAPPTGSHNSFTHFCISKDCRRAAAGISKRKSQGFPSHAMLVVSKPHLVVLYRPNIIPPFQFPQSPKIPDHRRLSHPP